MPQSFPPLHRPPSILPQTPSFMPRGGGTTSYFPQSAVMGNATIQPSPNPQLSSLQQQQTQQQQLQQQQQQSNQNNGISHHLTATSTGGNGTSTNPSTTSSTSDTGLDPNDFPALGSVSGPQQSSMSSTPAGSLLSSYASQAGTAIGGGPGPLGIGGNNTNGTAATRDFGPDDFPALGGQPPATPNLQGQQDGHTSTNGFTSQSQPPPSSQQQHTSSQDHSQILRPSQLGSMQVGAQNMMNPNTQPPSRGMLGFPSDADKRVS